MNRPYGLWNAMQKRLHYTHLNRIEYAAGLQLQHELLEARKDERIPNTFLTVEHNNVYTLGRRGKLSDILVSEDELRKQGIAVHASDRGGEVTYHGEGQLVSYPIIKLSEFELGANTYVRLLERLIIELVGEFGIKAHCVEGKPGVYVKRATDGVVGKIAAIGVRISAGVAMHGFAVNITTNLKHFDNIVACGSPGMPGASIQSEAGSTPTVQQASQRAVQMFADAVDVKFETVTPDSILKNSITNV
jgi:lipoyl(octanoyl) transferase